MSRSQTLLRTILWCLFAVALSAVPIQAEEIRIDTPQKAVLVFTNGRRFSGELEALNAKEVRFKLGGKGAAIIYKPSQFKEIRLEKETLTYNTDKGEFEKVVENDKDKAQDKDKEEPADAIVIDTPQQAYILLNNGRMGAGQLQSLNSKEVRFSAGGKTATYLAVQVRAVQTKDDIYVYNPERAIFVSMKALQAQQNPFPPNQPFPINPVNGALPNPMNAAAPANTLPAAGANAANPAAGANAANPNGANAANPANPAAAANTLPLPGANATAGANPPAAGANQALDNSSAAAGVPQGAANALPGNNPQAATNIPPAEANTTTAPRTTGSTFPREQPMMQQVIEKRCSKCNKVVSSDATAGGHCPHCGVRWDYETDQSGTVIKTSSAALAGRIGGIIAVIIGIMVGIVRWAKG